MSAIALPIGKRVTLSNNSVTYLYDFDELTIEQVNSAVVLFNLYNEMVQSPPKDVRTLDASGMTDMTPRALAYLLLQLHGEEVQNWSNKQYNETLQFIRSLKSAEYKKLLEIKADFFDKANIVDTESLKPLKGLLSAFGELNWDKVAQLKNIAEPATTINNDSNDSTNTTSTDEE